MADLTLTDALDLYFTHAPDLAPRTRQNMRQKLRTWSRFAGDEVAARITSDTFDRFRNAALAAGLAPFTVQTTLDAVMILLRHLGPRAAGVPHGRGILAVVPYPGRRLRLRMEPRRAPTLSQISAVYEAATHAERPSRGLKPAIFWRALLCLFYNTGLRSGDARRLDWSQVSFEERFVQVAASKTGKLHWLPINGALLRHLESIRAPAGPVLPFARTAFYLQQQLDELCDVADVERFTPQGLRRRAAIEFERLSGGAGSLLLGHTLRGMTFRHYVHALDALRPLAEKLPQPAAFLST